MVQLFVELAVPVRRFDDVLQALEAVMRPARLDRRCTSASIWRASEDARVLRYQEEWADALAFEHEARGERLGRLLELLEIAQESPTIEVRSIAAVQGLDYFELRRNSSASAADDLDPGARPA